MKFELDYVRFELDTSKIVRRKSGLNRSGRSNLGPPGNRSVIPSLENPALDAPLSPTDDEPLRGAASKEVRKYDEYFLAKIGTDTARDGSTFTHTWRSIFFQNLANFAVQRRSVVSRLKACCRLGGRRDSRSGRAAGRAEVRRRFLHDFFKTS